MKNHFCNFAVLATTFLFVLCDLNSNASAQQADDYLRALQAKSVGEEKSDWIFWGDKKGIFSNWTNHSNRLIPVYTFGGNLDAIKGKKSAYRDTNKLENLYGKVPDQTFNKDADYFDQTQLFTLQKIAADEGKKNIIVMIFDGMDWQTSQL